MMSQPLISVLIPCWNRVDTIERCVRSALDNGYPNLQVIISDNASSDGTWDIVRRMTAQDHRIRSIRHAHNRGPLANWRACFALARGSLIHWLWSDDWVLPGFYRSLVDGMSTCNAQAACAAIRVVDESEGRIIREFCWPWRCWSGRRTFQRAVRHRGFMPSPAAWLLPKAEVARQIVRSVPRLGDIDCMRCAIGPDELMILSSLLNARRVYAHPDPLVNFSAHPGSISVHKVDLLASHYAWARLAWSRMGGGSLGIFGWLLACGKLLRVRPSWGRLFASVRCYPLER